MESRAQYRRFARGVTRRLPEKPDSVFSLMPVQEQPDPLGDLELWEADLIPDVEGLHHEVFVRKGDVSGVFFLRGVQDELAAHLRFAVSDADGGIQDSALLALGELATTDTVPSPPPPPPLPPPPPPLTLARLP